MKYEDVRLAFRARMLAYPGLPTVVDYENVRFDKSGLQPWVRENLKPVSADLVSLGPKGKVRDFGLYLIDVFVPTDSATKIGSDLADGLREYFYPGLVVQTVGGQTAIVRKARRYPSQQEDDWYKIPIGIEFFVDTFNTQ